MAPASQGKLTEACELPSELAKPTGSWLGLGLGLGSGFALGLWLGLGLGLGRGRLLRAEARA